MHEGPEDGTNMRLVRALRRFLATAARNDMVMARELGLHTTDLATLDLVFSSPEPLTPGRIADHLGLTSGAATGAIDRIERAGYVRRLPNPGDRRGTLVEPLQGRADDVLRIYRDVVDRYDSVFAGFSPAERQVATRLLEALCDQDGLPRRR
ncbi:MarR family winged helix-turn-helix transcriptional regulator [Sphingomonas sp. ACRSK]|uniref:MarR family winged helix-turn-helix transcriptional regulator n=1 Tax=Sphingomonas sp. ACRSK TaxID=2918213 RepID=UPI001EF6C106|nr:MarR family transcriptional regulator [Sphingomonas sp. ACRSK]MCG7348472.1 MarR family transcriptional regulator [Sphingomonas sp. ACRSK]